jgi:hypothetical protein
LASGLAIFVGLRPTNSAATEKAAQ